MQWNCVGTCLGSPQGKRRSRDSCDLLRLSCSDSSYTNLPVACSACYQDKWCEHSWIESQSSNIRWRRVIWCFVLQFCARCLDFFEGGHSTRASASAAQHLSPIFLHVRSYWPWQELKDNLYLSTTIHLPVLTRCQCHIWTVQLTVRFDCYTWI